MESRTFEQALARLEEIDGKLDRGDATLAESLQFVAEATELVKFCRAQLAEAEGRLEQLVEAADGSLRVEEMGGER